MRRACICFIDRGFPMARSIQDRNLEAWWHVSSSSITLPAGSASRSRHRAHRSCLLQDGHRPGSRSTGRPGAGGGSWERVLQVRTAGESRDRRCPGAARAYRARPGPGARPPRDDLRAELALVFGVSSRASDDRAVAAGSSRTQWMRPRHGNFSASCWMARAFFWLTTSRAW